MKKLFILILVFFSINIFAITKPFVKNSHHFFLGGNLKKVNNENNYNINFDYIYQDKFKSGYILSYLKSENYYDIYKYTTQKFGAGKNFILFPFSNYFTIFSNILFEYQKTTTDKYYTYSSPKKEQVENLSIYKIRTDLGITTNLWYFSLFSKCNFNYQIVGDETSITKVDETKKFSTTFIFGLAVNI